MSTIGRVYRARKYMKKATDRFDMRILVKSFQQVEVDLKDFEKILETIDLKDSSNQAFLVKEWEKQPLIYSEYNKDTIKKMKWIDFGNFQLSLLPILKQYTGSGIPLQLMFMGKDNLPSEEQVRIFAEVNDETLVPDDSSLVGEGTIAPRKLSVTRGVISGGYTKKEDNRFLLVFRTSEGLKQLRVFIKFEYKQTSVNNFEELKETKFLGLADEKHIHPNIVKKLTQYLLFSVRESTVTSGTNYVVGSLFALALFIGFPCAISPRSDLYNAGTFIVCAMIDLFAVLFLWYGIMQLRSISKAKKLMLIPKDAKELKQINYDDPLWINDYCQISENWYIDEKALSLFEASRMI